MLEKTNNCTPKLCAFNQYCIAKKIALKQIIYRKVITGGWEFLWADFSWSSIINTE